MGSKPQSSQVVTSVHHFLKYQMAKEFETPNSRKFEIYYVSFAKNNALYPEVRTPTKMVRIDLLNSTY